MFKEVVNYGQDNGYVNDYYYRHHIYPEYHKRNDVSGEVHVKFLQDQNVDNIRTWDGRGEKMYTRHIVNCNDVIKGPWDITAHHSDTVTMGSRSIM